MARSFSPSRAAGVAVVLAGIGAGVLVSGGTGFSRVFAASADAIATPRAQCGPGSLPETGLQGRVSAADIANGRAAKGYSCNVEQISHFGTTGGYKNFRYVDAAGHECAYYDTTLLFPTNVPTATTNLTGVYVLDMTDPAHPVKTDNLLTPAMQTPHESLSFNAKRGLLGAVTANPTTYPGLFDLYDVSQDCRHPVLKASLPTGVLGHEGNFSPDGNTFYSSSTAGRFLTAIDVSNAAAPLPLWTTASYSIHGLNVSDDGTRLYLADLSGQTTSGNGPASGVTILDVSEVQKRVVNPQVKLVSHLTWPNISIPQVPIPVKIGGHPYLVEVDEFSASAISAYDPTSPVGAARIIDIADDTKPFVVSDIRLEVNQPDRRAGDQQNDPGATSGLQGYAGHYCAVPQRNEPGIVACSFILSGLRVFDIRDPHHPREIAYYNAPPKGNTTSSSPTDYAMSAPAFVPSRSEIWYSDGNSGFYALRVTNHVWPSTTSNSAALATDVSRPSTGGVVVGANRSARLPATGAPAVLLPFGAALLALSLNLSRLGNGPGRRRCGTRRPARRR